MRTAEINRSTTETVISLSLNIDGTGVSSIHTGIGFFDHMLTLFAKHGRFDLTVSCAGDLDVDGHHSVEDIGICLGCAFKQALGDKRGIARYADITLPMDEALVLCAADVSGRPYLRYIADIPSSMVGAFSTELVKEFFRAFVITAGVTLNVRQLDGENSHHIIEAMFKALGRVLRAASRIDPEASSDIPSTKGVL